MSRKAIRSDVLAAVVADQQRTFTTRDVSEDERLLRAHPELAQHRSYDAFVGGALSDNRVALGVDQVRVATSRGSRWEKRGPFSHAANAADEGGARDTAARPVPRLGAQYRGDKPFAALMRRHQSWYRAHVLGVAAGTGPTPTSKSELGNMLTRDHGAAGMNFLTAEIAEVARERVASGQGAVEEYRLFHNLLSSQPMCFNLFGPLVKDKVLARRLVATLVPDDVAEVTFTALEYGPEPTSEYLGDRTAFDAFVEYRTADGQLCALGIETKLTEPFSQKEYDGDRYRRWMRVQGAPWAGGVDQEVHRIAHNQLWRDHLLAVAMRYHPRSEYAKVRLLVLHHPLDPECTSVIAGYRQLLRPTDDTLLDLPLNRLHALWSAATNDSARSKWLTDFATRYLELERSSGVVDGAAG